MGASASSVKSEAWGESEVCNVAVIYEDGAARELALQLCSSLACRFNNDPEFAFTWWGFKFLSDPEIARQALQASARADLIVVAAVNRTRDLPATVKGWFENWLLERKAVDGALVTLQHPAGEQTPGWSRSSYFRSVAERARLDYLPLSIPGAGAT